MQKTKWWVLILVFLAGVIVMSLATLLFVKLDNDRALRHHQVHVTVLHATPCVMSDDKFDRIFAKEEADGSVTTEPYSHDTTVVLCP